ncbi:Uncharacterised protein [Klebsiella pneumoniae]|uniref:Uncharacterized protein n=1 Tax=Klebsiella pneumoniae TaxID=573 RepID=A0A2X3CTA5_KLEPN|nr:Uncharacterised protein [Klebsiella pneumoniae]
MGSEAIDIKAEIHRPVAHLLADFGHQRRQRGMPALLRLHQAKALVNAPLEVAGGIALGALANLHHPFEVEQSLLNGAAEGGAVAIFSPNISSLVSVWPSTWMRPTGPCFLVSARRIGRVMVWSPPRVSGISG